MLDTMTLTKITGAFCGSLLVFLLGSWVAEELYHADHGHGKKHAVGYEIYVEEPEALEEAVDEELNFDTLLAAADLAKGAKVFGKCKACHKLEDGAKGTGPHLYQVVDRAVSSVEGYGYSGALIAVADIWTAVELNGFLENPKNYAPGTKMGFAGLKKPEDRANVIAYLKSVN
ncbi:MAG: cytochrome c family protein [Rhodobacteraceae bacterium]|nr:cytochrome c family protein [Paracoccaceae bacterium]